MTQHLEWSRKSAENAKELAEEAKLLFHANHQARAYYLAHMSTEESSKSIILALIALDGIKVKQEKLINLLRNHKKKIDFLLLLCKAQGNEISQEISSNRSLLITHINDMKNATIYVSLQEGRVFTPVELIKEIDVESYISLSESLANYSMEINKQPNNYLINMGS